ncbi:MAG TPA: YbaK/EbsC family protein [Patescibacteria group bacterium]|nr:YbaK/EbsC family protein [Patescibacteria group bacterium]
MHDCSNRLQHFLNLYRVPYSVIEHAPAFTSQVAAAAMHVPGREMAKAVILQGPSQSYMAVLPACYQVDLDRIARAVGEPVKLASEERIRDLFPDCELGAIPPFGRLYGVETYVDETLAGEKDIVFPAGSHSDALRMSYQDFQGLAEAEVCSFAAKTGAKPRKRMPETGRVH